MTERVLGLDVGDRTIGVAVSDEALSVAIPLHTLRRTTDLEPSLLALAQIIDTYGVTRLVVGWPLHLDGQPGAQAQKVRAVARALKARFGLPIERFDERLTSVSAERALIAGGVRRERRRALIDTVAAALILQAWLDRRRHRLTTAASPLETPEEPP